MAVEGIFGSIIYGRSGRRFHTFYEIDRKYAGRFGEHEVHLRKPLLEYAGPALVEIDMSLNLDASWSGDPLPILAEWHVYQEGALAAPLIVGGKPMGPGLSLFVITELSEHHKHWLPRGRLIAVELRATFKEYIAFSESSIPTSLSGLIGMAGFGQ